MIRGPVRVVDLCYQNEELTKAKFDTETGNYKFQSTDRDKYPPGKYSFMITGTSGGMSTSIRM